jgi:hypothetical protein
MDAYIRAERIAIRMDSGMTEAHAVRLTDSDVSNLADRVAQLAMKAKMKHMHDLPPSTKLAAAGDE